MTVSRKSGKCLLRISPLFSSVETQLLSQGQEIWLESTAPFLSRGCVFVVAHPGALPIMDYAGRLRPKGVPFSGWRYIKG